MNVTGMKQTESSAPVIVIGAGPAGLYAAFQLGLRGHRPVIIDTLAKAGGQCSALYPEGEILDAPGFSAIPAAELTARLEAQLEPFRPLFLRGRRATAVWGSIESGFNVETNTGETITGGAVVYAGGIGAIRPKRLAAQGLETIGKDDLSYEQGTVSAGRHVAVVGDGAAAVDAALEAAGSAASVALIHALPLRASPEKLAALREAAESSRLAVIQGEVDRLVSTTGRLSGVEIRGAAGRAAHQVDLLLVQAGLELIESGVTGLGPVVDMSTGETATKGVFTIGDAMPADGRPPVIAIGFAEAIRAAEAAHERLEPKAARSLPHTATSPTLRARLKSA